MEQELYNKLLLGWSLLAGATFVALFFVTAPYGRHVRRGWGPTLPARTAWFWMELVAVVGVPFFFILGDHRDPVSWLWLVLWEVHYIHRTLIYPNRRGRGSSRTALSVVLMAMTFNVVNAYLNGRWLFTLGPTRELEWLVRPQVLAGLALFAGGMALNLDSDHRLLRARRESGGYAVVQGGAFRWVSCPNYLGEIVEWTGFAPRAWANHRWNLGQIPGYPPERRALIPFVW